MPTNLNLLAAEGYFELEMSEEALDELGTADLIAESRMGVPAMRLDILLARKRWQEALPVGEALCDLDPDEPQYFIKELSSRRHIPPWFAGTSAGVFALIR